ncbi:MAG: energy transducer TonB [Desulfatiglans sp.]|jgi:protein TonB|nr:energy transducer TonB [Desulfatiglans sp.]
MKRMAAAVVMALLFHGLLFSLNTGLLRSSKKVITRPDQITVTMSYRKPEMPAPVKPPTVETKKREIKKLQKPDNAPAPVKVQEISDAPVPVSEERVEITEDVDYPASSSYEESIESQIDTEPVVYEEIFEAEPLYRVNPEPPYPKMARKRGYQGKVLLSVLVNKEGRVDNLWVFESSGYNILDNAALEAVKDWLFEPGRQGDNPVEMWVQVPVKFEIK